MTESLPYRIAWFAPWTWPLWMRLVVGVAAIFMAMIGFALAALMLWPVDIYIHDTYIRLGP